MIVWHILLNFHITNLDTKKKKQGKIKKEITCYSRLSLKQILQNMQTKLRGLERYILNIMYLEY